MIMQQTEANADKEKSLGVGLGAGSTSQGREGEVVNANPNQATSSTTRKEVPCLVQHRYLFNITDKEEEMGKSSGAASFRSELMPCPLIR